MAWRGQFGAITKHLQQALDDCHSSSAASSNYGNVSIATECCAVAVRNRFLVVMGGCNMREFSRLSSVDILDTSSNRGYLHQRCELHAQLVVLDMALLPLEIM